jgi:hypothetical protein
VLEIRHSQDQSICVGYGLKDEEIRHSLEQRIRVVCDLKDDCQKPLLKGRQITF